MKKIQRNMLHENFQKIRHFLKRDSDAVSNTAEDVQELRKPMKPPMQLLKGSDERIFTSGNSREEYAVGYMEEDSTYYGPKAFRPDTYAS